MKRQLVTMIVAAAILTPASGWAQVPGAMLFGQGCDAFDLVEDLGSFITEIGQEGRWLMRDLKTGSERIFAFETIDLLPPVPEDPTQFGGTTLVAWRFEGTGIQGTNRTSFTGTILDPQFNFTVFFEGELLRGTRYKTGGISGTAAGQYGGEFAYDAVRMVLCKAGFGGPPVRPGRDD